MILIKGISGKVNLLYVFFGEIQDGVFQFFSDTYSRQNVLIT